MAIRFAYSRVQIPQPVATLGGQTFRLRPIVDLTVIGPGGTVVRPAVLDTGADEIVLPEDDVVVLGIDLSRAPSNLMWGVGGPAQSVRYAPVRLRLTDGSEFRE